MDQASLGEADKTEGLASLGSETVTCPRKFHLLGLAVGGWWSTGVKATLVPRRIQ